MVQKNMWSCAKEDVTMYYDILADSLAYMSIASAEVAARTEMEYRIWLLVF